MKALEKYRQKNLWMLLPSFKRIVTKKNVETEKGKIPENPRGAKKYPGV